MNEFFEAIEKHSDAAVGTAVFILFIVWAFADALGKRKTK